MKMLDKARRIKEVTRKLPIGIVTGATTLLITLPYLILSYGYIFIPNKELVMYGFSPSNLLGVITYPLLHLSPQHLFANVALLIAVGIIAEEKLNIKDYLSIFFISSIVAGIVFHILTPKPVVLVGASSAISGILAASIFIDIKKAVIAIIIFGIFLQVTSPAVTNYTQSKLKEIQAEGQNITQTYNETIKKRKEIQDILESLKNKLSLLITRCEEGNQTACSKIQEVNETKVNKSKQEQIIEEKESNIKQKANQTIINELILEQGIERDRKAQTSSIVHMVGAIMGILYLAAFRKDIIWKMPSQVLPLEDS